MRDLKKATSLKLDIWGTTYDLYLMQYILGHIITYLSCNTNSKLKYSLVATDKEGKYEALGTDDTEFILDIVNSIVERSKSEQKEGA